MAIKKVKFNERVRPTVEQSDYKTLVQYKNQFGRVSTVTKAFAIMAEYRGEGEIIEESKPVKVEEEVTEEQPKVAAPKKKKK